MPFKQGEIAYQKQGNGKKVLIFIHGLSSNSDAWYRNIKDLKKNFTCIAIDLPGYGRSFKNSEEFTPTYFASILNDFTDQLKISKFSLIGHSMGGQASIKFASQYPEKLEKLILIAPAGIEEFSFLESNALKMVMNPQTIMATSDEQIEKNYQSNFYKMPLEANQIVQDRKNIKKTSDFELHSIAIQKSVSGMLDDKVISDLKSIKTPTLFLYEKNDLLIPNKYLHPNLTIEELMTVAKNSISGSKAVLVGEAGHFLQFEKPVEVNQEIRNFINTK